MINKDKVLAKIYKKFFNEAKLGRFGRMKKIMMEMNAYRVDVLYLIAILTVTAPHKKVLGDVREIFYNRTDNQCTRLGKDPHSLLEGLE